MISAGGREPYSLLQLAGMKKRLLSSPKLSASSGVFEAGERQKFLMPCPKHAFSLALSLFPGYIPLNRMNLFFLLNPEMKRSPA